MCLRVNERFLYNCREREIIFSELRRIQPTRRFNRSVSRLSWLFPNGAAVRHSCVFKQPLAGFPRGEENYFKRQQLSRLFAESPESWYFQAETSSPTGMIRTTSRFLLWERDFKGTNVNKIRKWRRFASSSEEHEKGGTGVIKTRGRNWRRFMRKISRASLS